MEDGRYTDILIGPRTTVFTLIEAYPFLVPFLLAPDRGFGQLARPLGRTAWARVTCLNDVAVARNVSWRQLAREIAAEVARCTGRAARLSGAPRRVTSDDRRLAELREIVVALEAGKPLLAMAARWRRAVADLEPPEAEVLERALAAEHAAPGQRLATLGDSADESAPAMPSGHPLASLRLEGACMRELCAALAAELERLGGSPTRRRWGTQRAVVSRIVDALGGVERRYRRERQAWFPALAVHRVDGPRVLLEERQAGALETLRQLRLSVARDDAQSVAEAGARLLDELGSLLQQEEQVLMPLAARHLSVNDWVAVRELEEGVGWRLIPPPPPWSPD